MSKWTSRAASALAIAAGTVMLSGTASANPKWNVAKEIVGQTSTGTVVSGGDPIYVAPKPQWSGAVGLLMDYGAAGAFVCSGSLINRYTVVTAAHCVSDGTAARPDSTTVFFYGGQDDPALYAAGSPADRIAVSKYTVHQSYTGEVVDQNDIAVLRLAENAPDYAPAYALSNLSDLTGVDHTIAGYGVRSDTGGSVGSNLGTGRLRYADNRFDFRFGDSDFGGYWDNAFGTADTNNVWLSDFDNGTAAKDGSCNAVATEGFSGGVFASSKYCDLGRGAREGIGGGGDSGAGYFVEGKLAAVHSFAFWYEDDESNNRFGQLKGAVSIDFHRQFIANAIPEPATWAMMVGGFGLLGGAIRRRARANVAFA